MIVAFALGMTVGAILLVVVGACYIGSDRRDDDDLGR